MFEPYLSPFSQARLATYPAFVPHLRWIDGVLSEPIPSHRSLSEIGQLRAGLGLERFPIAIFRNFRAALVGHLEEQQIRELFDVVPVVNTVVAQRMAEAPEFLDDVGHVTVLTTDCADDTDKNDP